MTAQKLLSGRNALARRISPVGRKRSPLRKPAPDRDLLSWNKSGQALPKFRQEVNMQENPTGRSPGAGQEERPDESLTTPAVNADADEFKDGKRLSGSSSVSARDALLGGAPGPLLGDDMDTVNFPDNDPAISSTDNADASTLDDPDTDAGTGSDTDLDAPFADIGGEGGGPGAGPGPA